jgi:hypothetical protein
LGSLRIEEQMTTTNADTSFRFDDRAITWRPFRGPVGLSFWVLRVDEAWQHVDILFRLGPFARCVPHNHVGPTNTLVIEGEHRTYQKVGGEWTIDEIRTPGTFSTHDGDSAHVEEGGPAGATILLSMTAVNGVIWTLLDDNDAIAEKTTVNDFVRALQKQNS